MTTQELRGALNLHPSFSTQDKPLKNQEVQHRRSPMPIGIEEGVEKRRCAPTSQWTGVKPMGMEMQWTSSSLMAVGA